MSINITNCVQASSRPDITANQSVCVQPSSHTDISTNPSIPADKPTSYDHIESVDFSEHSFDSTQLELCQKLPNLKLLIIRGNQQLRTNDRLIEHIATLLAVKPAISHVGFLNTGLLPAELTTLSKYTSVNYEHAIIFENNTMRNRDFKDLATWPHLTHLKIVSDRILEETFERYLGRFKQLQMLDLRGCTRISDAKVLSIVQTLPNFRDCGLPSQKDVFPIEKLLTDKCVKTISKNTLQTTLKIKSIFITTVSLSYIDKMTKLEILDLRGCIYLTDANVARLAYTFPNLKECGLPHQQKIYSIKELVDIHPIETLRTDKCVKIISQNTLQTALKIKSTFITAVSLSHIETITGLEILDLRGCIRIPDTEVMELTQLLPNLRTIGLPTQSELKHLTELTDDDFRILAQNIYLQTLTVRSTALTNNALKYLFHLQELRVLDLRGSTNISDENVLHIIQIGLLPNLQKCGLPQQKDIKPIVELIHNSKEPTDVDVQFITQNNPSRALKINSRLITSRSLEYIENMQYLHTLDLRGCAQISDKEVLKLITRMPYLKEYGLPHSKELTPPDSSEMAILCRQMKQLRLKPPIMPRIEELPLLNSTEKPRLRRAVSNKG